MKIATRPFGVALLALGFAAAVAFFPTLGEAADPLSRYPYDPACAWGRIANGRGLVMRCLTQAEANELLRRAPPAPLVSPNIGSNGLTWRRDSTNCCRVA